MLRILWSPAYDAYRFRFGWRSVKCIFVFGAFVVIGLRLMCCLCQVLRAMIKFNLKLFEHLPTEWWSIYARNDVADTIMRRTVIHGKFNTNLIVSALASRRAWASLWINKTIKRKAPVKNRCLLHNFNPWKYNPHLLNWSTRSPSLGVASDRRKMNYELGRVQQKLKSI